jgi:hypothetical protein
MGRVAVVVCITLVACDRGAPKHREPPPAATARDAAVAPPVDAAIVVVDAEVPVDAMPLAPPKAPAQQKLACSKIAKMHIGRTYDNDERREYDEIIRKLCVQTPWSATVVDCLLRTKPDGSEWDCFDLLPDDQHKEFDKQSKESFCKYNDCIPDDMRPTGRPGRGSGSGSRDDEIDKILNGN